MKQTVDMRKKHLPPIVFGDSYSRDRFLADCAAAKASQVFPLAVAPRCVVHTTSGRALRAGDEVQADWLHPNDLRLHLGSGAILAKETEPEPKPEPAPQAVAK